MPRTQLAEDLLSFFSYDGSRRFVENRFWRFRTTFAAVFLSRRLKSKATLARRRLQQILPYLQSEPRSIYILSTRPVVVEVEQQVVEDVVEEDVVVVAAAGIHVK